MRKMETIMYICLILVLAYYVHIANKPKVLVCQNRSDDVQVCTVMNYLGK